LYFILLYNNIKCLFVKQLHELLMYYYTLSFRCEILFYFILFPSLFYFLITIYPFGWFELDMFGLLSIRVAQNYWVVTVGIRALVYRTLAWFGITHLEFDYTLVGVWVYIFIYLLTQFLGVNSIRSSMKVRSHWMSAPELFCWGLTTYFNLISCKQLRAFTDHSQNHKVKCRK